MDSRLYWIWLQRALPLASRSVSQLLDIFGSAVAIYEADETALAAAGVRGDLRRRLADKSLDGPRRILDRMLVRGDWVLTPEDALYPAALRRLPHYPVALYCRGVMPDLTSRPAFTVVGTRHAHPEGCCEARALAAGLAAGGMVVVGGGAVGIDAAVHTGALEGGGLTIVVMACPLDVEYPAPNAALRQRVVASGGLLVSEYPEGEPYRCDFHVRNRLLAGLSHGVCLGETPRRSGALITAHQAAEMGRDVYAMPGSLSAHINDGAHREIQQGAMLVVRATDILQDYAALFPGVLDLDAAETAQKRLEMTPYADPVWERPPRQPKGKSPKKRKKKETVPAEEATSLSTAAVVTCPPEASADAVAVFAALEREPLPVDTLAERTALSMPRLLAALTELEMFGCASNRAGGQYNRL